LEAPDPPTEPIVAIKDGQARCADATCSVGSCMSTGEPHEHICASHGISLHRHEDSGLVVELGRDAGALRHQQRAAH
jgi:hypothetical protein